MFPKELIPYVLDYSATGSRVICDPPVMDTDEDWVVLVPNLKDFAKDVAKLGYNRTVGDHYRAVKEEVDFNSYRKGEINLIVYSNKLGFDRFRFATRIATALNLREKADRIALFKLIKTATTREWGLLV